MGPRSDPKHVDGQQLHGRVFHHHDFGMRCGHRRRRRKHHGGVGRGSVADGVDGSDVADDDFAANRRSERGLDGGVRTPAERPKGEGGDLEVGVVRSVGGVVENARAERESRIWNEGDDVENAERQQRGRVDLYSRDVRSASAGAAEIGVRRGR